MFYPFSTASVIVMDEIMHCENDFFYLCVHQKEKRLFFSKKKRCTKNPAIKYSCHFSIPYALRQFHFPHPYSQLLVAWKRIVSRTTNQAGLLAHRSTRIALFPVAQ
jgi:hypothetical protein